MSRGPSPGDANGPAGGRRYRCLTRPRFDADANAYRMRYDDADRRSLLADLALGVAEVAGVPVTTIDPLYETLDPETLTRLCGASEGPDEVTFGVHGHEVTVGPDGARLRPPGVDRDRN